ncbi:hypothetical protein F8O06_05290 [Pseudoclavibacter sp. CFCC 14310]|uniref:hypothetical protein n=1 Tax=Pseudoclavibacter sp. CFCC 14310 TaxID=2615180 RepID=UPI00130130B8|nr:hypothetical protein [Pseudoclavibacter sp. CFCC 14310]KAB1646180.1 hypothetical protein F8O06_05290 [Pseudoclavibacter sp. CFCC 14310]
MSEYAPDYAPKQVPRPTNLTNKKPQTVKGGRRDLPDRAWPSGVTLAFMHRIDQIKQFQRQTGRFPREDDPNGRWIREKRTVGVTVSQGRVLDQELPGWRRKPKRARSHSFEEHLEGMRRFIAKHGVLPNEFQPHGMFLSNCRAGSIVLTPERLALLDTVHPDWRHGRRAKTAGQIEFDHTVSQVRDFLLREGRYPAPSEPNGAWLICIRRSQWIAEKLTDDELATLNRELPGWSMKRPVRNRKPFEEHVDGVVRFRAKHGRFPYRSEPEGVWFASVRRYIVITPERKRMLDTRLPGWDAELPRSRGKQIRPNLRLVA